MKSPQPSKVAASAAARQRRSTGSNRSSKEGNEEANNTATAAITNTTPATDTKQETEDKIKAILEHASKQQEIEHQQQQLGLLREVQQQPALSVYPTPAPPMQVLQRLPIRPPPSVVVTATQSPATITVVRPNVHQTQNQPIRAPQMPPLANSPGLSVVQLPTQPLPASEIARTSKQVLLEPKSTSASSPKIPIPSTSPRSTPISLPTQPVPVSAALLTPAASAIVARTMSSVNAMPMLPNQPLPPISSAVQITPQPPQPQVTQQPKLPQHPLPPSTTNSLVVTTRPESPAKPPQHMALKKRVIAQATADESIKLESTPPSLPTSEPAVIMIKKESHMKPRDAFGRGAHLVKDEKAMGKILQPPPPSSPSLAAHEQQLAMIREQEVSIFFQALIKQGNPEPVALSLAQELAQERYKTALSMALNNERSANVYDGFRPSPLPAHLPPEAAHRQTASPAHMPAMAHSNSRSAYIPDRHAIMSLNPPASPEPDYAVVPNLDAYPMVWKGFLGLKNEFASVEFRYVSGCKDLANASLPHEPTPATLRIGQRMRLEAAHLSGVRTKMQQAAEHCVLLALPCGTDPLDVAAQSRQLRSHFITYLQLKGAAGIVNVPGLDHLNPHEGGYVVHVFPSCDFANETMTTIAPDLLAKVAEIEHMVIVIATVLDKTSGD